MDETLSWGTHISEVSGKVAKALAALRRLKPICPQGILVSIYESSVLSHLDYCSDVWGNIGAGLSQRLEKLQNTSARIITGTGWDVRSPQILRDLDPNIYQRNLPTPIPFTDIICGAQNSWRPSGHLLC